MANNGPIGPHIHAGPAVIPLTGGPVGIPEVKLSAGIEATFGKAATALDKIAAWADRTQTMPRYLSLDGGCTTDSSGNGLIQLGPVPQGMRFTVHQLVVGGVTWGTSVSGTADVFILPWWSATDIEGPLTAIQDQAATLPNVAFYSRGQFIVPSGSSVWVQILAGSDSTQYAASIDFVAETEGS